MRVVNGNKSHYAVNLSNSKNRGPHITESHDMVTTIIQQLGTTYQPTGHHITKHFNIIQSRPLHLLLIKRYKLCKVLACSTTFFQLSLFCATFFQLLMCMLFIPSKTPSPQRVLDLPIGLLDMGFHLLIYCTILSSAMRSTWPNQYNLCFLINPIIFCSFNISFISWLVLILQ